MSKQATCADRIAEHLTGRLADFTEINARLQSDDDEVREQAQEEQNELPLSVEKLTVVKVLLSTGGPGDWFEAHCDSDGEITRIEYVFQDWFDSARRVLDGDEFKTAEAFLQDYVNVATENY